MSVRRDVGPLGSWGSMSGVQVVSEVCGATRSTIANTTVTQKAQWTATSIVAPMNATITSPTVPPPLLAWTLLGGAPVQSLDPRRLLSQYRTQVWGTAEGLPSMSVAVIAQTPDGYLWVGTTEGLARFDGNRFFVFDRSNTPAFRLNEIRALCVDRSGILWVGFAGGGLARFERDHFVDMASPESDVLWIGENDEGLWLAGEHGLWRRKEGMIERVPLPGATQAVSSAIPK